MLCANHDTRRIERGSPGNHRPKRRGGSLAHRENQAIIDAGLAVQFDDPTFAENWDRSRSEPSVEGYRRRSQKCVEILDDAIRGLPQEKILFHLWWGNWHGARSGDIPMKHLVDLMLRINARADSFEAGNARQRREGNCGKTSSRPRSAKLSRRARNRPPSVCGARRRRSRVGRRHGKR